jgi:hypothetical protein
MLKKRLIWTILLLVVVAVVIQASLHCDDCNIYMYWTYYCSTSPCYSGPNFAKMSCDQIGEWCYPVGYPWMGKVYPCDIQNCVDSQTCCDYPDQW